MMGVGKWGWLSMAVGRGGEDEWLLGGNITGKEDIRRILETNQELSAWLVWKEDEVVSEMHCC